MLGEKELSNYLKEDEVMGEKKEVDVNSIFDAINENLGKLVEAMADLGTLLNKNKTEKVEEVEEVKEIETEEEKEV